MPARGQLRIPLLRSPGRSYVGRDPRSPQSGTLAYTPPPVSVSANINAKLDGAANVTIQNNVNVTASSQR